MVTSVQIDERTKKELLEYASSLQTRLGRKVSFDDAIKLSLEEKKGVEEARRKFGSLYGCLSKDKSVWKELENARKADRIALEKKAAALTEWRRFKTLRQRSQRKKKISRRNCEGGHLMSGCSSWRTSSFFRSDRRLLQYINMSADIYQNGTTHGPRDSEHS